VSRFLTSLDFTHFAAFRLLVGGPVLSDGGQNVHVNCCLHRLSFDGL